MLFRKVSDAQYEFLMAYVAQTGTPYDTKVLGSALLFGLSGYHWRKLEYAGMLSSAAI